MLWRTAWLKRRQGMFQAAREDRASLKQSSLVTKKMKAGGDPVNDVGSPHRAAVKGEAAEGLPGSKSVARNERRVRKLGGPMVSRRKVGRRCQPNEGEPMNGGESDRLIVPAARGRGKRTTELCSPQRKHPPVRITGDRDANLTAGNSGESQYDWTSAEANSSEEPGAGKLHAGIREGAVG